MAAQPTVAGVYEQRRDQHNSELQALLKRRSRIGWLRLFVIIATVIVAVQAFSAAALFGISSIIAGLMIFLFLVSADVANNNRIAHLQNLLQINKEELEVLSGRYDQRFDGAVYLLPQHPYAADLDLFGNTSLFQYINRCNSGQGRNLLAQSLLDALPVDEVEKRQEAVNELTPQLQWRQHLQALLLQNPITVNTQEKTGRWLVEKERHFTHPVWPHIIPAYSIVTIASAVGTALGYIDTGVFSAFFVIYLIFAFTLSRSATKAYMQLNGIVNEISTLQESLHHFEMQRFQSLLLNVLLQSVKTNTGMAHGEIKKLKDLLNRFDMRLNVYVFLFLNTFLLWDVRQMISLNRWRRRNKTLVANWFAAIAELEVLNSLATLRFNNPAWAWPQFTPQHFTLDGEAVGHPLIPQAQCVVNDFQVKGGGKVALITGSNMAGKSTFLRSLGVNVVLAQLGAPVCAQKFLLSPVQLLTSMRIADNLAESTSTFYAELKKLKHIIEAVKQHKPVFILLDEVLRGTNSLDRHTGTEALIRQFIRQQAVGVIATHDLEIARLEGVYPDGVANFHFDVQVAGEELYFDYKLKQGVCTSLNASLLMKKIGIELEDY